MRTTTSKLFSGGALALILAVNAPANAAETAATNEPVADLRHCSGSGRTATRACILALQRIGAPQLAHKLADKNPGALTRNEYRWLEGDKAAALVRWGPLETPDEADRFKATDRAIAAQDALIAKWSKENNADDVILRARFDRMVALRDRVRMKGVVAEYDDLNRQNIEIPGYALQAAADATLYLRKPEEARDLYLRVLEQDPENFDARMGLFYAYVETEDFDAAYRQIDALVAEQGTGIYLKGAVEPMPNPYRDAADLTAAQARFYGEELSEADRRISAIAHAAPHNPTYRAALGSIYAARGWPRRAQEQNEIGLAMVRNRDVGLETGQALTELDLQHYPSAEAKTVDLLQRFPENLSVQRAARQWQVHNMAVLRVDATYGFRPSTSAQGGDGFGIETQIYSSPINYHWRLFASEFLSHEAEPNTEGDISLWRTAIGAEYRNNGLTASAAPTYNRFEGKSRLGGRADASYALNDTWEVGGYGEIFSRDTPLRGLNSGVTANAASAHATYRASESREIRVDGTVMDFSDDNMRTGLAAGYTERLYTAPHWKIDGLAILAGSRNSEDANRFYYNPSRDAIALLGAEITQTLYRRYERVYEHSLRVTPGTYWQEDFGSSLAADIRYEQRVRSNDVTEAGLGIAFSRQAYDGVPENNVSLFFNFVQRF